MTDYQVQPSTRRCAATERELHPGEKVYSVLLVEEGKFVRKDFSPEAWPGPPAGVIGFWQNRVATPETRKKLPINDELLTDFFEQLEGQTEPAKVNIRYVLALLLMRRKRLRFEESATEGGQEVLMLRCSQTGAEHRVANPGLAGNELESVQGELFKALGWD